MDKNKSFVMITTIIKNDNRQKTIFRRGLKKVRLYDDQTTKHQMACLPINARCNVLQCKT